MRRLTQRDEDNPALVYYPDCKGCSAPTRGISCTHCVYDDWHKNNLCEYEDAEEQNCLLILPIAIGGKIYTVSGWGKLNIEEYTVNGYRLEDDAMYVATVPVDNCGHDVNVKRIGDTWFKTREEAEKKLKEMENT